MTRRRVLIAQAFEKLIDGKDRDEAYDLRQTITFP
jgi:hypothetical protein